MSVHAFTLILTAGAALLALWFLARFPRVAPRSARGASLGLVLAILALAGTPPGVMLVGNAAGMMAAALLVALPGGICVFVATGWIMLWVIRTIQPHLR